MQSRFPWSLSAVLIIVAAAIIARAEDPEVAARAAEFRVDSELVLVPVSVVNRMNRVILGLAARDFTVSEDGAPQQVLAVSRWDVPASIGVVLDTSGSMKSGFRRALAAVQTLLHENGDEDEAFLLSFADSPRLETPFSNNSWEIPEKLLWARPRGATALFDGVYTPLVEMRQATNMHKALVVITDGGDNHSRNSFKELLSTIREADVQLFAVAIRRDPHDSEEQRGRLQLEQLANETGGHLVIADSDAELPRAVAEINELIRNQYLLSYRPSIRSRDGKWHRVRVGLQPPWKASLYRVHSKNGYYALER